VLHSLIPGREPDERVTELKPWVRVATTIYVVMLVPALALIFGAMVLHAPRAFATAWDSFFVQSSKAGNAFGDGKILLGLGAGLQMAALVLPAVGFTLTFARMGRRIGTFAWQRSEGHPHVRLGYGAVAVAALGLVAFTWWPNGEYRPIQPNEKGTLASVISSYKDIPSGRPALTAQRAQQLHGAPAQSARFPKPKDTSTQTEQQVKPGKQGSDGSHNDANQTPTDTGGGSDNPQEQSEPDTTQPQDQSPQQSQQQQSTTPTAPTQTAPTQQQTTPSTTAPSSTTPSDSGQAPTTTTP
jgi:hypothetical protein